MSLSELPIAERGDSKSTDWGIFERVESVRVDLACCAARVYHASEAFSESAIETVSAVPKYRDLHNMVIRQLSSCAMSYDTRTA